MKVAGSGSRSMRCMNCLELIKPAQKRGHQCTLCLGTPRKQKKRKKRKITSHARRTSFQPTQSIQQAQSEPTKSEPTPPTTPLSDYVEYFETEPVPVLPDTIAGLEEMFQDDLIELAIDLGLEITGSRQMLILRVANEIGIV